MRKNKLFIMCPCYNEEEILCSSAAKLKKVLESLIENNLASEESKIVFVDDGSRDDTWKIISGLSKDNKMFHGIKFARNFGQYAALLAGYMYAKDNADLCISLDVDLQDDISILPKMMEEYHNGCEVVLAIRNDRTNDSFMKKFTADLYYKVNDFLDTKMIKEHPDFRLLSKKALDTLSKYEDPDPYMRGIIPLLGYKTATVEFKRQKREAGTTKFNYKKLIQIAVNAIVKTTNRPLLFPIIPIVISFIGLFVKIKQEVYWMLLFMCQLCLGLYIGDVKKQVHKAPPYTIDIIVGE